MSGWHHSKKQIRRCPDRLRRPVPTQDHHSYLRGLRGILEAQTGPFVVVGDYNQRVPRKWQPLAVYQALVDTFEGLAEVATGGVVPGLESQLIDHLAHGPGLKALRVQGLSRYDETGKRLSDHDGVMVDIRTHRAKLF